MERDCRIGDLFCVWKIHCLPDDAGRWLWHTEIMMKGRIGRAGTGEPIASRPRIQLLIADDNPLTRSGLRALLASIHGTAVDVIGEAASGAEAVHWSRTRHPNLIIMDVRMPGMDGIEATRLIKGSHPGIKVVVLSLYASYEDEALAAGADAFLVKSGPSEKLLETILDLVDENKEVDR